MKARHTTALSRVLLFALAMLQSACMTPNGVLFIEGTKFALDATASASDQSQPLTFSVGYKRDLLAVVPKKCFPDCKDDQSDDEEALSMISSFSVWVEADTLGWPNDLVIRNNFASGRAAIALTAPPSPAPAAPAVMAPGRGTPSVRSRRDL